MGERRFTLKVASCARRERFRTVRGWSIVEIYQGLEVGAVAVKLAELGPSGQASLRARRHEGRPRETLEALIGEGGGQAARFAAITGIPTRTFLDLPYRPEAECIERALAERSARPDMVLLLGGESFVIYTVREGVIRNIISSSKCAAGTGEFLVQQLARMGFSLEEGLQACGRGRLVRLATRCSVHCKSDATHKLNKGECSREDIARSLIRDLALKIEKLMGQAMWPRRRVVVGGGLSLNRPLVDDLRQVLSGSELLLLPESHCLEAFGAALHARDAARAGQAPHRPAATRSGRPALGRTTPLAEADELLDYRATAALPGQPAAGARCILGVDAGSTTTKAVLLDAADQRVLAGCYLRTNGNPVESTRACLQSLRAQAGDRTEVVLAAVTGSGRQVVSVFLGNCLAFNEILAHARAAAQTVPEVETIVEIGGQDSKYISLSRGVPVDSAMNEGCSAGTGSFLEEAAALDMGVGCTEISELASASASPVAFGERCAAFINTDVRNALQQGAERADVVAGLVHSIADNYVSRVLGDRPVGSVVLFQGGVALNQAVARALALRLRRCIVVPPHPELMGCIGAALMARDLLVQGTVSEDKRPLDSLATHEVRKVGTFPCQACDNICEIQRLEVSGQVYPFGGLCSRYENERRRRLPEAEPFDGIRLRQELMFDEFRPPPPRRPRGTVGIPLALTTYQLFPLYARLVTELGFEVVTSGRLHDRSGWTLAPMCYPSELAHRAVEDLIARRVDHILLPYLIELQPLEGFRHGYVCAMASVLPGIVAASRRRAFDRFLTPQIFLSGPGRATTLAELSRVGERLGVRPAAARRAAETALSHQERFEATFQARCATELYRIRGAPLVVLAGRPYTVCAGDVNLSIPRKIASRGYRVVPADALPPLPRRTHARNCWRFTQQVANAVEHARRDARIHLCFLSCFSCGPDANLEHDFRHALEGRPFCSLVVDSHTAHAGIENRIEAFLEIVERMQKGWRPASAAGGQP